MKDKRYQCLIVDDEELGRQLIATHLQQLPQFQLVAQCRSAVEAGVLLNEQEVDLLFLDIEMPVLKGTDFYNGLVRPPSVIFTTAYRDYAVEGFELEAVDYLLKPITFARFFKAVERFLAMQKPREVTPLQVSTQTVFVRADRKDVRLDVSSIHYVQSLKDYIRIHTDRQVYTVHETLTGFLERVGRPLLRVHRSYAVNGQHVQAITVHDVEVAGAEIPIGETYTQYVRERLGF